MPKKATQKRVRLKPQDPFDLIRLLARSQSDPRKAVAELVQNSLDAGAGQIAVTWYTERGRRTLKVRDDGEGIFPELEREEALRRIARTIGHSHKRDLTPAERREQMVLGKYGIGLIGFWSVGEVMEIKSRVGGGQAWCLRLVEDKSQGDVYPSRSRRVDDDETYTEVTIHGVHEASINKVRPARLQAFLANELRGQLLERDAVVHIRDRVARGRAKKLYVVEPRPYLGRPLDEFRELLVPDFDAARVELYLVSPDEDRQGVVALSCGGTLVLEDIALIDGDDAPRAPWTSGQFEGVIDFPDLVVAPSTRRGFVPNEPVQSFLEALSELERELAKLLQSERERRVAERQESLAKDIRRAFRSVALRLPEYDLFQVRTSGGEGGAKWDSATGGDAVDDAPSRAPSASTTSNDGGNEGNGASGTTRVGGEPVEPPLDADPLTLASGTDANAADSSGDGADSSTNAADSSEDDDPSLLFPPGPLASVELRPKSLSVPPLATRTLRARALDADGRPAAGEVAFEWSLIGPGVLEVDGSEVRFTAPEGGGPATIGVRAIQGEVVVTASLTVRLKAGAAGDVNVMGIPEPTAIHAPAESWRSRVRDGQWEYNDGHRDYEAARATEAGRLRYLIHLFAKEVVLRNFGGPGAAETLERMVEILTCLEADRRRT